MTLHRNHSNDDSLHNMQCKVVIKHDYKRFNQMFKTYELLRLHQLVHNHERWFSVDENDSNTFRIPRTTNYFSPNLVHELDTFHEINMKLINDANIIMQKKMYIISYNDLMIDMTVI